RLWDAIRSSYENRNFTGSIQDSMYFLTSLIRERTGLEGDGAPLVGRAFGGRTPLLKVNKLQTESEKNVQQGVEQLLRGLYQAVRNPRSHDKYLDTEQDAIAIILFINYVIKIIDKSKSPFINEVFITRIFDIDFVSSDRYADY
ncbi:MAG: TIGR02391 family protein, partial [Deltaproteobacteria bacterium]|nr:TIGR02391 family protein [Deltaproteobacteria bacterium]